MPTALRYAILIVLLVALWQAYVTLAHVPALLVASPLDVFNALVTDLANGKLISATQNTLANLLVGIFFGALIGFVFAAVAVFSRVGDDLLSVSTSILIPLPSIAILPLAMIWFGLNSRSIVFVVALAAIWPVAINTDSGFRTISATTQMVARNLGLRGARLVYDVLLPAALPYHRRLEDGLVVRLAHGRRRGSSRSGRGLAGGLGRHQQRAPLLLTADIFAGLLVISILGIAVDFVFRLIEQRTIVKWGMKRGA